MGGQKALMKIACPSCRQKLDVTDLAPFARIRCPRCGGDVIAPKPFGTLLLEEPLEQRRGVCAYRALDLTLDREVLVKILERDAATLGDRFQALARRAAAVNHSGVVPIYSCGAEQGFPYLVTQFMPGGALASRLEDCLASPASVRRGVEWSRSIAGGLQAAAAQDVVHGAVTPLSILLDAEGHAKLTDFGLEVLLAGSTDRPPAYGRDAAPYLSPEVLRGDTPSTASDVFGLGAVLYHLLCGSGPCGLPVAGEAARSFWDGGHEPQPPSLVNPDVPQELSDVCMRMLHPDPGNRPHDLGELLQLLTSRGQLRNAATQRVADRRCHSVHVQAARAPQPQVAEPPRTARERWMNALIAGCVVVVLVLGMALYVRTQGYPSWLASASTTSPPATPAAPRDASAPPPVLAPPPASRSAKATVPEPGASSAAAPVASDTRARGGGSTTTAGDADPDPDPDQEADSIGPYVARRPRPPGLDFMAARLDLARYLRDLPPTVLAGERERIELISDTRSYLVRLMKYVPFMEGKESDIRLRSGPPLRGSVPYCNDSQVALRVRGDNALRMVPWSDLAFEQVIGFLDFYIRVRLDQGQATGGTADSALRREVAEDCLRGAVLCDWYERPQDARRYARQALDADPATEARAKRLLPTVGL